MDYLKYLFENENIKLIIEEDIVGFYLYVFKDHNSENSDEDYLLDTLEEAFQEANDIFGITSKQWILIRE